MISLGGCFGLPSTDPRGLKAPECHHPSWNSWRNKRMVGKKEQKNLSELDTEYWAGRGHHCFNECKHHLFIFSPPPQTFSTTATYRGCLQPPTQVAASTFAHTCPPTEQQPPMQSWGSLPSFKALSSLRQELGWSRPPPSPQYLTHCLNLVGVQLNTCGQDWMGSPDLRKPTFNAVLQAASINPFKLTQDLKSLYHLTINKSKLIRRQHPLSCG